MGRFLLALTLLLNFAYAQDDYYADEPVENYDAYEDEPAPMPADPNTFTKDMPKQLPADNIPPADFADSKEYSDDPYPVNEESDYEDSY